MRSGEEGTGPKVEEGRTGEAERLGRVEEDTKL